MKSHKQSTHKLSRELLRTSEDPSSLDILEWLLHLIPRDLSNILLMSGDIDRRFNFDKLGGTSWYFRAAFDETYEADGYDVNSDKLVPVLETVNIDAEDWLYDTDLDVNSSDSASLNPKKQGQDIPLKDLSKKITKDRKFYDLEEFGINDHYSEEHEHTEKIKKSVKDEIETQEIVDRIITFFGFPSRRIRTEINYKLEDDYLYTDEDKRTIFYPIGWQLLQNLIGGWDDPSLISTEKRVLQWLSLFVKIPVILPIKLLTLLPKTSLNILKLFTEFFPLVAKRFCAHAHAWAVHKYLRYKSHHIREFRQSDATQISASDIIDIEKLPDPDQKDRNNFDASIDYYSYKILCFTGVLFFVFSYFLFRALAIVGRAVTSPEKSMRMAFRYGRMLKISFFGQPATYLISLLLGTVGASFSLALTIAAWGILFPILIGALTLLPLNTVPILTVAVAKLSSIIISLPLGNTLIVSIQSLYTALSPFLLTVFAPHVTKACVYLLGLKLTTNFILTFSFVGVVAAVIAPRLSHVADVLSDLWATWKDNGPITYLFNFISWGISLFIFDSSSTHHKKEELSRTDRPPKKYIAKSTSSSELSDSDTPSHTTSTMNNKMRSAIMSSEDSAEGAALVASLASKALDDSSSSEERRPILRSNKGDDTNPKKAGTHQIGMGSSLN